MNSLFLGFIACFISYLIVDFLGRKLDIERRINRTKSIRISVLLIVVLFNIISVSLVESFATREYQFLLKSFLAGATLYFIVFILPISNRKNKL